ncbi:MAG: hypothetical protein WCX28_13935 [Bacteriovoracaceae bacterium]|nr:hypothetical protein [Bacteroidota bacterium]
MVGLEKFRQHFAAFKDNYVIIGGTACDILLSGEGFTPRATKDIDIILVIENLSTSFVGSLWDFLKAGKYKSLQKDSKERKYYRFTNPAEKDYPRQIELFSSIPDSIDGEYSSRLLHIDIDKTDASLSAILMDETYYSYTIANSSIVEDLHRADINALICLKAKAYLDLTERKSRGEKIDDDDIKKHKTDIFRLGALLTADTRYELPDSIGGDFNTFMETVHLELPETAMLAAMGAPGIDMKNLYAQLRINFQIVRFQ